MPNQEPVEITGAWVRRIGDNVEMLIERNGNWYLIATEHVDGAFSHIVEPNGIRKSPEDRL
jgi:hypothetical protein